MQDFQTPTQEGYTSVERIFKGNRTFKSLLKIPHFLSSCETHSSIVEGVCVKVTLIFSSV